MKKQERLDLKRLMSENTFEDNTDGIRRLKHSVLIKKDILQLEQLKLENAEMRIQNPLRFELLCKKNCSFLFNAYMDIFNRVMKDELDLNLLSDALSTLEKIELGEIDQQEGSILMGKQLYKIYVEGAIKRSAESDKKNEQNPENKKNEGMEISWKEYKLKKKV